MAISVFGTTEFQAGGGTETYLPSGVIERSTTTAGTPANTDETDLWTYSLPANSLDLNGKGVRITVYMQTAANGNTKTLKVYFGATAVITLSSTYNNISWRFDGEVIRTGASAQLAVISADGNGGNTSNSLSTPAADTTAAITIRATGTNGSAQANDIVFRGAIVEFLA